MPAPNIMLGSGGKEVVAIDARDLIPGDLIYPGGATITAVQSAGSLVYVEGIGMPGAVYGQHDRLLIHNDRF